MMICDKPVVQTRRLRENFGEFKLCQVKGCSCLLGRPSRSKRTGSAAGKAWSRASGCGGGGGAGPTPPRRRGFACGVIQGRRPWCFQWSWGVSGIPPNPSSKPVFK
jgi:hypothetical protein